MTTLFDLFSEVKDAKLSLERIEDLRDQLVHLHTMMQLELADCEKAEAMYFAQRSEADVSDVSIKRAWKATEKGQRQIELNRYVKATAKEVDSLKSRVFRLL